MQDNPVRSWLTDEKGAPRARAGLTQAYLDHLKGPNTKTQAVIPTPIRRLDSASGGPEAASKEEKGELRLRALFTKAGIGHFNRPSKGLALEEVVSKGRKGSATGIERSSPKPTANFSKTPMNHLKL